jgi:hypothetical protein
MPLSHLAFHIAFCKALERLPQKQPVTMAMRLVDPDNRTAFEQTIHFRRSIDDETDIETDVPRGVYAYVVRVPREDCSAQGFIMVLPNADRDVAIQLRKGFERKPAPLLVSGATPVSFAYVKPTFVLFPGNAECGKPIPAPLNAAIQTQYSPGSYYTTISWNAARYGRNVIPAVDLTDASGGHHYVRVRVGPPVVPFFPSVNTFDVGDDLIDMAAGKPEDTLICVRMMKTITGG